MQPPWRKCLLASLFALSSCATGAFPQADTPNTNVVGAAPVASVAKSADLTNADVIEMTRAGISPPAIVAKISTSPCRFDTSVEALEDLRASGVETPVLSAMMKCRSGGLAEGIRVWIGANQERVSESSHVAAAAKDVGGTVKGVAGTAHADSQMHSEYADTVRAFAEKCPAVIVTEERAHADYSIAVERYHAGHLLSQRNGFTVFRERDGALVLSDKTTWLKNAATDICRAITADASRTETRSN